MADFADEESSEPASNPRTSAKRRKVRQGTHSCWECKRRKTKCIFLSSLEESCIGCQQRRMTCVSQDWDDVSRTKTGNRNLAERLSRLEETVRTLVDAKTIDAAVEPHEGLHHESRHFPSGRIKSALASAGAPITPTESLNKFSPTFSVPTNDNLNDTERTAVIHLWAALPAEADIIILLSECPRTSCYVHAVNTQPGSKLTLEYLTEPHPEVKLPHSTTHPAILAKFMLVLAITLQVPKEKKLVGLSESQRIISHRLVTAVSTWVTCKEEMLGTVNGLICTMFEVVYRLNSGNLRQAWATNRRAMTQAQLMGFHRSRVPDIKHLGSTSPTNDVDPRVMWFRIVYLDRYLSVLLGLPQGIVDGRKAPVPLSRDETPTEQFDRSLSMIASRILERNGDTSISLDVTETHSIDSQLLLVSHNMPSAFWRPANFQDFPIWSPEALLETVRLTSQVFYFGLLIHLHLPRMIYGSSDNAEMKRCSKITCMTAGREIITRFIAHRNFNPTSFCSRPTDFFTLLAAMTLLLAHIDAHYCQRRKCINVLAHQRLTDRAMIDEAVEMMDTMGASGEDIALAETAKLIRSMLNVEADAAEGRDCRENDHGLPEDVRRHINTIVEQRSGAGDTGLETITTEYFCSTLAGYSVNEPFVTGASEVEVGPRASHAQNQHQLEQQQSHAQQKASYSISSAQDDTFMHADELPSAVAGVDEWIFQGVDVAFFDSLMREIS